MGETNTKTEKSNEGTSSAPGLSAQSLDMHNRSHEPRRDWIVVRIEVADTGCGIPPKEMVQSKLFCKFGPLLLPFMLYGVILHKHSGV
jgi:hypothetical protein